VKTRKISKAELIEKQLEADKRFNRRLNFWFVFLLLFFFSLLYIQQSWCVIRLKYRMHFMYGKAIHPDWVCMNGNELELHITEGHALNKFTYFVCSHECFNRISKNYQGSCFTRDTITGQTVNKADAVIGLRSKNKPDVVYFANRSSFMKYYNQHAD